MEELSLIDQNLLLKIKSLLSDHEGYRRFPYFDTVGKITIGIGYNLTDRGLDDSIINSLVEKDIQYFYEQLNKKFDWFNELSEARKCAIIDMAYNLGMNKFLQFKKMITFLSIGDFENASKEMLNSKWASQIKFRAVYDSELIKNGVFKA